MTGAISPAPGPLLLTLFVAGPSARTTRAVRNLQTVLVEVGRDPDAFELVDILDDPAVAEEEGLLAAPTLSRTVPGPEVRIIGDLADHDVVRTALGL